MERSVLDITLDLQRTCCPGTITVTRGDTHRTLRFYLSDGGRPYPVDGLRAVLTATKPDGNYLFNDCALEGDRIVYHLTPQTTACPGLTECQLRLYGGAGELLHTAAFTIIVEDTVYGGDETITSAGEVTTLTKLVTDADEKLARMDTVLKDAESFATIDDSRVGEKCWSSKKLADLFCPSFTAEGAAVRCTPLEGYPLEVVSHLTPGQQGVIRLCQSGKNIIDVATAGVYHNNPVKQNAVMSVTETGFRVVSISTSSGSWIVWGFCLGTAKELAGKTITLQGKAETSAANLPALMIATVSVDPTTVRENPQLEDGGYVGSNGTRSTLKEGRNSGGYAQVTYTVTGEEKYKYIAVLFQLTYGSAITPGDWTQWSDIQVEIGDTATAYEPYRGQTLTADLTQAPAVMEGGSYNWTTGVLYDGASYYAQMPDGTFRLVDASEGSMLHHIPGLPGENVFYSTCGDTCVTGRTDIRSLLEKQL